MALQLAPAGQTLAADLARHQLGPVVRALEGLEVWQWLAPPDPRGGPSARAAADPEADTMGKGNGDAAATAAGGVSAGGETKPRPRRLVLGFRVCHATLPPGADLQQLARAWVSNGRWWCGEVSPKTPYRERKTVLGQPRE